MTNSMIILLESVKLMEQGKIKGSGIKGLTPEGKEIELPETIHTYQTWKQLGFQVKKGSKAVAQFPVWKYVGGVKKLEEKEVHDDLDIEQSEYKGHCFMKVASFFTREQVEEVSK